MRERVSVINGNCPLLLVAPHGADVDDVNTDILTEELAKNLNCYAVINRGFDRADYVDVENDKADCNRIDHVTQDIVFEEFLKPILKIQHKITGKFTHSYAPMGIPGINGTVTSQDLVIFYIHGMGDNIHKIANEQVDVVIGYGLGTKKDSLTCKKWRKNLLVDVWRDETSTGEVYEGRGGGKYAGRSSNNLNQYFRKHQLNRNVDSMQLEIPNCFRKKSEIKSTVEKISTVLDRFTMFTEPYSSDTRSKFI